MKQDFFWGPVQIKLLLHVTGVLKRKRIPLSVTTIDHFKMTIPQTWYFRNSMHANMMNKIVTYGLPKFKE